MIYFLKRLLLFIPTLLILSLIFFYLSKVATGDPTLNILESERNQDFDKKNELETLRKIREKHGLNQPLFYLSIYRKTSSDTIKNIGNKKVIENFKSWSYQLASWEKVNKFYSFYKKVLASEAIPISQKRSLSEMLSNASLEEMEVFLSKNNKEALFQELHQQFLKIRMHQKEASHLNNYLPDLKWHGLNNQYHEWLSSLLHGNLGTSYIDGKAVSTKISEALKWTLVLSLSSLLISLILTIPLATYTATIPESSFSKFVNSTLLAFYSIPNFWLATLLIIYLTSGDYLALFPSYGPGIIDNDDSFFHILQVRFSHFFLPVFCISYGSIAYLYKQLFNSLKKELSSQYVQTALSKGLTIRKAAWKHAFKNSSLPLITILGKTLPVLFSGSFVIEYIFSIHGMGKLTIESFFARDYPMIFGILMIVSVLTLIGAWLADIFYQYVDPRISLGINKSRI